LDGFLRREETTGRKSLHTLPAAAEGDGGGFRGRVGYCQIRRKQEPFSKRKNAIMYGLTRGREKDSKRTRADGGGVKSKCVPGRSFGTGEGKSC